MTASGLAGLFGLFAGLCAIFAACATLIDWHDETAQARWPVVSAAVERADVIASVRAPKDGGGKQWKLRTRVHYELNGEALTATPTSRVVFSEAEAAKLRSWAAQHRGGGPVDIRIDPSQPNRAAFVSADLSSTAGRTGTDLVLLAVAAIACAGLLALAKVLRARDARAAPGADGVQRGGPAFGILFAAMGLMLTGIVIYRAVHGDPLVADDLMGLAASLMFVFAGILIGLPPHYTKWRNLLGALVITCFALTLDWVAFGPGERRFTGSMHTRRNDGADFLRRLRRCSRCLGDRDVGRTVPARVRSQCFRRQPNDQSRRFHSLTNGPFSPITGSVCGIFTCGIVFSAFA
jgi:hypothetical protein